MTSFSLSGRTIGREAPTYFIADIAANHDGDLARALHLMELAAEAGADAAKFQHFRAATIVSDVGFRALGARMGHQASWDKSVYEVYQDASIPWEWTPILRDKADSLGIEFMSTPYDFAAVDHLSPYVNAFKIGSGDLNWLEMLEYVSTFGKPMLIATGASDMEDVERSMSLLADRELPVVLMQCNTNYTGNTENLRHSDLRVVDTYGALFPEAVIGLSDHTPGHLTVLGAIALGARVIEKHFTDDTSRIGPDHGFSMDPSTWREMVVSSRQLESALGSPRKVVKENERDTYVVQRRSVVAASDLPKGHQIQRTDIAVLRPCPEGAVAAHELTNVLGRGLKNSIASGMPLKWQDLER